MDTVESLLREEFGRAADLDTISVSDLITSTRRIRRRRTVTAATCVVVIVAVLAVLGTTALTGRPRAIEPARRVYPIPGSVNPSLIAGISQTIRIGPGTPVERRFIDEQHGFVLSRSCPTPFGQHTIDDCTWALEATSDGGVTFTRRTLPTAAAEVWQYNPLYVFDATHLLVEDQATLPGTFGAATGGRGWVSADGGRSWSMVTPTPVAMVDRIPPGALLAQALDTTDTRNEPLLALRADGSAVELTTAPPDPKLIGVAANDSYFVRSGSQQIFVSTDSGHTWQLSELTEDSEPSILGAVGSRIYASLIPNQSYGDIVLIVHYSDDGGRTWDFIPSPYLTPDARPSVTPEQQDQGYATYARTTIAVNEQAGVLVNDGARTWRMAPGSDRFVADNQAFPIIGLINAGPVVLAISADPATPHAQAHLYISADGVHWRPMGSS